MQQVLRNIFGLRKRNTTLWQAEAGKHKCRNITEKLISYLGETIDQNLLHLLMLFYKVIINDSSKRQIAVFLSFIKRDFCQLIFINQLQLF